MNTLPTLPLHTPVVFHLTAEGVAHYARWCKDLNLPAVHDNAPLSTDRPYQMPLWEVMQVFGSGLYVGSQPLLVDNEMTLLPTG